MPDVIFDFDNAVSVDLPGYPDLLFADLGDAVGFLAAIDFLSYDDFSFGGAA